MNQQKINYAKLVIKKGINVQKGQPVIILSPIECYEFTRLLVKEAYEAGACEVVVDYIDEIITKLTLQNKDEKLLSKIEEHIVLKYDTYDKRGASYISISASNPDNLADVDPSKASLVAMARHKYLNVHDKKVMSNEQKWCVISVPTLKWSQKVFNNAPNSIDLMWEQILKMTRCDLKDPILEWDNHVNNLKKYYHFLNKNQFTSLEFKNNMGTDISIGLVLNHIWSGAGERSTAGVEFIANIPTEEVFTMPHSHNVNGRVYSSKPLNYQGQLIDEFNLTFKDGRVIDFEANVGYESLKELLSIDEGASRLGEVALVNHNSPISNSNILFYNTLFDENAACHVALGRPYPINKSDYDVTSKLDSSESGINTSAIHVDFMFGTSDMKITGVKADGSRVVFFENGNFTIE